MDTLETIQKCFELLKLPALLAQRSQSREKRCGDGRKARASPPGKIGPSGHVANQNSVLLALLTKLKLVFDLS